MKNFAVALAFLLSAPGVAYTLEAPSAFADVTDVADHADEFAKKKKKKKKGGEESEEEYRIASSGSSPAALRPTVG